MEKSVRKRITGSPSSKITTIETSTIDLNPPDMSIKIEDWGGDQVEADHKADKLRRSR